MIVNSNPECGDLLSADTCDYSPPDLLLFQQLPTECDGEWALVTSDSVFSYFVYDDYEAFGELTALHWWGCDLRYISDSSWIECDQDTMTFNIEFCQDNGSGIPNVSNPLIVYTVAAVHHPYAVCTLDSIYQLWDWQVTFDPPSYLQVGWVGIQGAADGDSCSFLWYSSDDAFGYNSYQTGVGYTDYQQAFCLNGM
ncbi:MAG: hypothetical protein GY855_04435 [candidate division Zixibacteria bacterium]|nr:hypothetical protein [candidate division Zixibacteria bacterium]